MELVYLWVEDYKNIHKQGFNFSPRFECKFHYEYEKYVDDNDGEEKERLKDNCKLDICEKKKNECKDNDYIENFFDDNGNISVTAIVGKNGSGKSSVLEFLKKIYVDATLCSFIFCFLNNDKKQYISNIATFQYQGDFKYLQKKLRKKYIGEDFDFNLLAYSSEMPYPYKMEREPIVYSGLDISFEEKDIYNIASKYLDRDFLLTSFMFFPEKIYIKENEDILNKFKSDITPMINYNDGNIDCLDKRQESISLLDNVLESFFIRQIVNNTILCKRLFDNGFLYKAEEERRKIIETIYNDDKYNLNKEEFSLLEFSKLLEIKNFTYSTLNQKEKNLIRKYQFFLSFDFEDKQGRKYSDLSHGEKTIFGLFINMYDKIKITNKSLLFLLDEPDLALHSQWQKNYISELFSSISPLNKKFHLIFTTHSPFLLSDIPKQNIIFLDKDEKGNCKVVDGLKEKKQTFGANIHTLLSDSFFMENGLMGEFAKGKIDKAIKLLNQDKLDEKELKYCEQIISIIGEPIVKNQLQRMLDSKRLKKVDEIDKIYEEIELLKHRIEILRKD